MDSTKVIFDCPSPVWLVAAVSAAVLAAVVVFARRDVSRLSAFRRHFILAAMALAGLMLVGLVLSPKLIRTWEDPQKPICCVLVDGSRSMLFSDNYKSADGAESVRISRAEVIKALLKDKPDGWLRQITKHFDVSYRRFACDLSDLSVVHYEVDDEGYSTDIGRALDDSAGGSPGGRLRAIVLLSDGAWNKGRDPSEVARVLGRLSIPVYVVGIGDADPPKDVALTAVRVPKSLLLGDKLTIDAQIVTTGLAATRVTVQLLDGGKKIIDEKQVMTLPAGRVVNVSFQVVPSSPGRKSFTLRVAKLQGERDRRLLFHCK